MPSMFFYCQMHVNTSNHYGECFIRVYTLRDAHLSTALTGLSALAFM